MGWDGRQDSCLDGSQQGPRLMGKGDVVAAGREGEEARADLGESRCWMGVEAEFVSLDIGPCRAALRPEVLLGLLLPTPPVTGSHPLQK